jgi:asparagine synthetase B (glutamine-hydrolysing)
MLNPYCVSSFLSFRYVVDKNQEWKPGWKPWWPIINTSNQLSVDNEDEIITFLKSKLATLGKNYGILLSGGIDSAILASFLPKGTHAYTIRFISKSFVDESIQAAEYAKCLKLHHHVIDIFWDDYLKYSDLLMKHKKSPLHAIEVALYKASKIAAKNKIDYLVVGNGADSTFGGMDKLLSKDWTFDEFVKRYTFIDPAKILKNPVDMSFVFETYKNSNKVDVQKFLKTIHGEGIIQTFCNSSESAGIRLIEPFESLIYGRPLDLIRIRNGESKYILRSIFKKRFPQMEIPEKIPFARPMNEWLKNWEGPQNEIFLKDLDLKQFSGDQKWLIYNLDNFIRLISK